MRQRLRLSAAMRSTAVHHAIQRGTVPLHAGTIIHHEIPALTAGVAVPAEAMTAGRAVAAVTHAPTRLHETAGLMTVEAAAAGATGLIHLALTAATLPEAIRHAATLIREAAEVTHQVTTAAHVAIRRAAITAAQEAAAVILLRAEAVAAILLQAEVAAAEVTLLRAGAVVAEVVAAAALQVQAGAVATKVN